MFWSIDTTVFQSLPPKAEPEPPVAASQQVAGGDCRVRAMSSDDETNDDGAADQKVWNPASFVAVTLNGVSIATTIATAV